SPLSILYSPLRRRPPSSTLFPYTTLFRSVDVRRAHDGIRRGFAPRRAARCPARSLSDQTGGPKRAEATLTRPHAQPGSTTYVVRSEEHTSELQSRSDLVCRLLLEKKNRDQ